MIASIRFWLLALALCAVDAPVFAKVPIPAGPEPGLSGVARSITSLDAGWRFLRADAPGAHAALFDDPPAGDHPTSAVVVAQILPQFSPHA